MIRREKITAWVIFTGLLVGSAAGFAPVVRAQGQKTAPTVATQDKKQGTGVVPPGVKLAPQMPVAGPAQPFHFPEAATKTLANGLRVFVVTDHREPAIAARLVLTAAGSIHDPHGLPGVASMTAAMLTQGTATRSAQQIAQAIDFVGGTLRAQAGEDSTFVTLSVVKKDLDLGMDLFSEVVLHPSFKKEELDRQREQLLSGLQVQYADAGYLATRVFDRIAYGDSPYGLPGEGTPESAGKLDSAALARFHDSYYAPNDSLLAFAGDITPEAAFAAAEKYFGAWPQKELPASRIAVPAPPAGLRLVVIDKSDAVQTQIRVGRTGIPRSSPDYIPLLVTNRVFGGGYNSRLNTEVRINKGLTYGASSSFQSNQYAGIFSAGTFTRTEATVEATKLVVDLIGKMATGDVTQAELDFARDYLAGVYPLQSETAEQVAGRVLTVAEYGLAADYNATYPDKIRAVNVATTKAMAGRYFDAGNLDLVLVGNAGKFRDALKQAFPAARYEEIPVAQLDVLASNLRRSAETAAATPEALAHGREVLLEAAKAAGGDAFNRIQSLEVDGTVELSGPGGQPISIDTKAIVVYPDRIRIEQNTPMGAIRLGYDGKTAWLSSSQGVMDAPPQFLAEFQRGIALNGTVGIFKQALSGNVEAQYLGAEEIDGQKTDGVQWNSTFGPVKLYFDSATHQLVAARYRAMSSQGPANVDQRWSNFKTVEGVQIPYSSLSYHDGAKYNTGTVKEVKVNLNPDASLFAKPQQ